MIKYIDLPSYDKNGNPTVQPINFYGMEKVANYNYMPKDAQEFVANITPVKNRVFLLISAVADECWGANSNSDFFPTMSLSNPTDDWGYKTYLKAHYFHRHENKDPAKGFGRVIFSTWDEMMGRVLVVAEVDTLKDLDTKQMLDSHQHIPTSMGMRVPYDVCRVCHPKWKEFYKIPENEMIKISISGDIDEIKAIGKKYGVDLSYITELNDEEFKETDDGQKKSLGRGPVGIHSTLNKYCDHMKYMRGRMVPSTGIVVSVVNMRPKFFDISKVGTNAEKSSYVLQKVASKDDSGRITEEELIEIEKASENKRAEDKKADIEKEVEGQVLSDDHMAINNYIGEKIVPELKASEMDLPVGTISEIAKYPIDDILTTFLSAGAYPRPREFQRIILIQMGKKDDADEYDRQKIVIPDTIEGIPTSGECLPGITFSPDKINNNIFDIIKPFLMQRSYYRPCMIKRIVMVKRANEINAYLDPPKNHKSPLPGILGTIAATYMLSKTKAGKHLVPLVKNIKGNPKLWIAAIVGSEVASRLFNYSREEMGNNMVKTSAKYTNIATLVGLPVASYLYAGHVYNKAKSGRHISGVEKFVAKNPGGVGIAAGLTANPHTRKAIKVILKGVVGKHAELDMLIKNGMDFNGMDITQYPIEDRDSIIASMWKNLYDK